MLLLIAVALDRTGTSLTVVTKPVGVELGVGVGVGVEVVMARVDTSPSTMDEDRMVVVLWLTTLRAGTAVVMPMKRERMANKTELQCILAEVGECCSREQSSVDTASECWTRVSRYL